MKDVMKRLLKGELNLSDSFKRKSLVLRMGLFLRESSEVLTSSILPWLVWWNHRYI